MKKAKKKPAAKKRKKNKKVLTARQIWEKDYPEFKGLSMVEIWHKQHRDSE